MGDEKKTENTSPKIIIEEKDNTFSKRGDVTKIQGNSKIYEGYRPVTDVAKPAPTDIKSDGVPPPKKD